MCKTNFVMAYLWNSSIRVLAQQQMKPFLVLFGLVVRVVMAVIVVIRGDLSRGKIQNGHLDPLELFIG